MLVNQSNLPTDEYILGLTTPPCLSPCTLCLSVQSLANRLVSSLPQFQHLGWKTKTHANASRIHSAAAQAVSGRK